MSETNGSQVDIRRIRRMLQETVRIAKDASLTESLQEGARSAARQYNAVLRHLEQSGTLPAGFFPPLGEQASFDEVGVAAGQLAGYLEEEEEPEPRRKNERMISGSHNVHINVGSLKELDDLKNIGQIIREHMPDWLRGKIPGSAEPDAEPGTMSEVESRLAEVGAKLQAVAEQLRRGDLSDEQRAELAEQLSQFGQEQARLARQHAMLREREAAAA
jgi:hypothetical protein